MSLLYVQFSDDKQTTVINLFSGPQNPDSVANLGTLDSSDPRYDTFYKALPDFMRTSLIPPG